MVASFCRCFCCSRWCCLLLLLFLVSINFHVVLYGRSPLEGIFASPLLTVANEGARWYLCQRAGGKGLRVGGNRTVQYSMTSAGNPLMLDIYEPDNQQERPHAAVLFLHGGAWVVGFREMAVGVSQFLGEARGVVGVGVEYRLASRSDGAGLAGCIDDAWQALIYVRRHAAELGIDTSRVFLHGESAGAYLAFALALGIRRPTDVNEHWSAPPAAVVAAWPSVTIEPRWWIARRGPQGHWDETPAAGDVVPRNVFCPKGLAETAEQTQDHLGHAVFAGWFLLFGRPSRWGVAASLYSDLEAAALSPLNAVRARLHNISVQAAPLPPVLMLASEMDSVVPFGQQEMMAETYRAAGGWLSLLVFKGADHGEAGHSVAAGSDSILSFLDFHNITSHGGHSRHENFRVKLLVQKGKQVEYSNTFDASRDGDSTLWLNPLEDGSGAAGRTDL